MGPARDRADSFRCRHQVQEGSFRRSRRHSKRASTESPVLLPETAREGLAATDGDATVQSGSSLGTGMLGPKDPPDTQSSAVQGSQPQTRVQTATPDMDTVPGRLSLSLLT